MSVEDSTGARSSRESGDDHEDDDVGEDDDEDAEEAGLPTEIRDDPLSKISVVQYLGPNSSYCGYCKRSERQFGTGRRSYDMLTYTLRAADYQDLLDRNWRRSGTYSYCPINQTTCCPNYPIICTATEFNLTRSHRKCIAKMNSYLATGDIKKCNELNYSNQDLSEYANKSSSTKRREISLDELKKSSKSRAKRFLRACEKRARLQDKTIEEAMHDIREKWNDKLQQSLPMECYLFPKKTTFNKMPDRQQQQQEESAHPPLKPKHVLKIDMVHVISNESASSRCRQHEMLKRYQRAVHKDSDGEWTYARFYDFLVKSPIIIEPLDKDKFDYAPGEIAEPLNGCGFESLSKHLTEADEYLLVRPPQLPTAYGTYHCNYYLDDKLIATGVLDVLPKCITTVYFFYDPDYGFLNLGIYSALVEISMVRQMDKHYKINTGDRVGEQNQLVNYYLGFYVHECKKMHYKTRFRPAYLLCSKSLTYVPIDACLKKLSDSKYADFADNQQQQQQHSSLGCSFDAESSLAERLEIPIIPPVIGLPDSSMRAYLTWLAFELGPAYMDLFLNGYLVTYAKLVGDQLLSRLTMRVSGVHRTLVERFKRLTKSGESHRLQAATSTAQGERSR